MKLLNVTTISPKIKLGDVLYNEKEILKEIDKNSKQNQDIILFPEYSLTGKILSFQNTNTILELSLESLKRLLDSTKFLNTIFIIGMPFKQDNKIYSSGFVFQNGFLMGIVPKDYNSKAKFINLPCNLGENIPFGNLLFTSEEYNFSLEFGEDLYKILSPSDFYNSIGSDITFNLSSLSYIPGNDDEIKSLIKSKVIKSNSSYIYSESSIFESTTDNVNKGRLFIQSENKLIQNNGFNIESDSINSFIDIKKTKNLKVKKNTNIKENYYKNDMFPILKIEFKHYLNEITQSDNVNIKKNPFLKDSIKENNEIYKEILDIQSYGVARRLLSIGINKTVIGISGGLDSTLALIVLIKAFKILDFSNKNIITITMPGFGTTNKTLLNSKKLCDILKTDFREIDIKEASLLHFKDISHNKDIHDNTYENVQARERTQILMDIANKENAIVIGTGDLSELALGWATFNGDQMSMYGVNSSIPKTLVKKLIEYYALNEDNVILKDTLLSILNTPISPELLPNDNSDNITQITEDIIGPYELHDFFLYNLIKYNLSFYDIFERASIAFKDDYDEITIKKWLNLFIKRFITQQFKRSSMPDGPKATEISLSPRDGFKIPSDMSFNSFLIK